jgi:hypothetical protein
MPFFWRVHACKYTDSAIVFLMKTTLLCTKIENMAGNKEKLMYSNREKVLFQYSHGVESSLMHSVVITLLMGDRKLSILKPSFCGKNLYT